MTESDVRTIIVDALEYASVFGLRDAGLTQPFLNGEQDARLDELAIDSLAIMELCIALEINTGAALVPADIAGLESLGQLAHLVLKEVDSNTAKATEPTTVPKAGRAPGGSSGIVTLFERLKRSCQSVNQLTRVHVILENRMTPLEVEALASGVADPEDREWSESLRAGLGFSGKDCPEAFVRKRLGPNLNFFSAGDSNRSNKTLAICYTGHAQRMMMPLPIFLQHLDSDAVDVLLLRDCSKSGYRKGVKGTGDSIERVIDEISGLIPVNEWKRAVTIGASGGGIPAVITALRLSLDAALSVGGNNPGDLRWRETAGEGADEILLRNFHGAVNKPAIFYAFGAASKPDREAGQALHGIIPTHLVCVGDETNKVGHNALYPLLRSGKLSKFLEAIVFKVQTS